MRRNSIIWVSIKVTIGLALLVAVIAKTDYAALLTVVREARPEFLAAAILSYLLMSIFEIVKFRIACEFRLDWYSSARLVLASLFLGNFLPTSIGGDSYKLIEMRRMGLATSTTILYVGADRIAAIIVVVLSGLLCWLFTNEGWRIFSRLMSSYSPHPWQLLIAVAVLTSLILLSVGFLRGGRTQRILHSFEHSLISGLRYVERSGPKILMLGGLLHFCRVLAIAALAKAFGFDVPLPALAVITSSAVTAGMLPISLGGLGVREGTFSVLLQEVGLSPSSAIAVALLNLSVLMTKSLIGGVLLQLPRKSNAVSKDSTVST